MTRTVPARDTSRPPAPGANWGASTADALAYLRQALHPHRRQQRRDRATAAYVVVLFVGIFGVPYLASAATSPSAAWQGAIARHTLAALPAAATAVALAVLCLMVRNAQWLGPVAVDPGTASWALPQPLLRERLLRPRLLTTAALCAAAGTCGGAGCGFLLATQGNGSYPAATAAGAWAGGTLLLAGTAAGVLVQRYGRTLPRTCWLLPAALVALAAGAVYRRTPAWPGDVVLWSGPWGWAVQPLAAVSGASTGGAVRYSAALLLAALLGVAAAAWRAAPRIPGSTLRARAQLRSQLAASLFTLELRQASGTVRAVYRSRARPRLRLPVPASRRLLVPWRDATALLRAPSRPARATGWLAVALALTAAAPSAPARVGAVCAVLALGAVYLSAAQLVEPARLDNDNPHRRTTLPWSAGSLARQHALLPAGLLAAGFTGGCLVLTGYGLWHPALLTLALSTPALLGGALVSAYRGSMPAQLALGTETPIGSTAPLQMTTWYARGPLTALTLTAPPLLNSVAGHGWSPLWTAWLLLSGALLCWASRTASRR